MKCKKCRKRMNVDKGDTDIFIGDSVVRVINLPVFVCPVCGERVIHDVIIARAKAYAEQYGIKENTLDFGLCEAEESESVVAMQMLGLF